MDDTGDVVEYITYSEYLKPENHPAKDVNGDRAVTTADPVAIANTINAPIRSRDAVTAQTRDRERLTP